jgi:hypothetical protein
VLAYAGMQAVVFKVDQAGSGKTEDDRFVPFISSSGLFFCRTDILWLGITQRAIGP